MPASWQQACWTATARAGLLAGDPHPDPCPLAGGALDLGLAEKTVKNYVSSILAKLEVARRAEAAAYLARHTTLPGT